MNGLFLLFRLNPVHDLRALEYPLAPQGIAEMAEHGMPPVDLIR